MSFQRFWMVLATAVLLISACTTTPPNTQPTVSVPTAGPLTKRANYWDLGLSIKYPDNWPEPFFSDGQMILSASVDAIQGQAISKPVVSVRIIDPARDLRLGKAATLEQIAISVGAGSNVQIGQRFAVKVAGVDAAAVNLTDTTAQLFSQAVAFRMPDGRIGTMSGVAPVGVWADFAPTFDQMRAATTLLKPADFPIPPLEATATLAQGGLTFSYPKGWILKTEPDTIRTYSDSSTNDYLDGSGFVNGPHLVIIAQSFPKDSTLQAALTKTANLRTEDTVTSANVGGVRGLQASYADTVSGQLVTFTGIQSQDQTILIVFRWTVPWILNAVLRPQLDAILQSVKFGPITATLIPQPTVVVSRLTPTPLGTIGPVFYNGIPQNRLPDGTFVLGAVNAPVRLIAFTDFACPACVSYEKVLHQFIDGYVRTGKARLEYRYLAVVNKAFSTTAAYAALCAGEQTQQPNLRAVLHDRLFALQLEHGMEYFTSDNLSKEAAALGLDGAALKTCIESGKYAQTLDAASALGVELKVVSPPTALIAKGSDVPRLIYYNNKPLNAPGFAPLADVTEQLNK